ncbi:MAG: DUF2953 domain-containing protein [Methanomicrobiales archaeon]|nr:DUF2953 domain-containing protein [Methanomicrobiales archaeon]
MAAAVLFTFLLIGFIAAALYLICLIPLDISLVFEHQDLSTSLCAGASWCLFSIRMKYRNGNPVLDILIGKTRIWSQVVEPGARAGEPQAAWDFRTTGELLREILMLKPAVMRIIRALVRHTRIRRLACDIRFGFSSPAVTGMAFGCYTAIRPVVMQDRRVLLSVSPVFDRELLEGSCRCDLRVDCPLVIPALVIRLFLSPRTWHLVAFASPQRKGARA